MLTFSLCNHLQQASVSALDGDVRCLLSLLANRLGTDCIDAQTTQLRERTLQVAFSVFLLGFYLVDYSRQANPLFQCIGF